MEKIKLGDICQISSAGDKPLNFTNSKTEKNCIPVIANGLENSGIIGYTNKATVTEPAITVSARGNVGSVAFRNEPYFPVIRLLTIIPNPNVLDVKYLYYYLKQYKIKGSGSVQAQITVPDAVQYCVYLLGDVPTQKRIAKVLFSIDKKIENNNAITSELEDMAKDLYDYWFVQFDFPDENGKPYKSNGGKMVWNEELKREIPAGWCVDALRSHITSSRGISYDTKALETAGIPMINLASFSVASTYKPAGIKNYGGDYSKEKVLHPYDLVMCNTQQTASDPQKDIIGKSLLVPDIFDGDVVSSHHVTSIKTDNDDLKYYFNATFKTSWFHKYVIGFASGTNILGLDFKGVENYLLPIPPASVLQKFADFSHNMEAQKSVIIRENEEFTSLRDFLLPMLMNGQVTVKDTSTNSTANG